MIDLHTHSCFSDGSDTPTELIEKAVRMHLSAIALTDHNTMDGVPEFWRAAAAGGITAVPGVEVATDYDGTELHMVGLFVTETARDELDRMLRDVKERKLQNTRTMVEKLAKAGYDITFEEVQRKAAGSVNRVHVATVLMEKGVVSSVGEAFSGVLSEDAGFYRPGPRLDVFDVIAAMRRLDVVPVLAHSFLNLDEAQLRAFLPKAVSCGLQAMEVLYATYDADTTATAGRIAAEFGLSPSGGSDYHGSKKPNLLARGCNGMEVPDAWLDGLAALRTSGRRA